MKISTVGLDLAKNVFQVHAVDSEGTVVVRRALRRRQVMGFPVSASSSPTCPVPPSG